MRKIRIALVGAGGFANTYLTTIWNGGINPDRVDIQGIIDPVIQRAPRYQEIVARGIPYYDTLEEFYKHHSAELVIIASPVSFHLEQVRTCLAHGSHVLCEKPLTPLAADVALLEEEANKAGLLVGVGFQWSFSRRVRAFKQDILDGRFGKPVGIRTFISWMRGDGYFSKWHGKLKDDAGNLLMDSIFSNAMAHYLHFGLFILGDRIDLAKMPARIKASLYHAKKGATMDTVSVQCQFDDGVYHNMYLTHDAPRDRYLIIEMKLEHATATIFSDYLETDGHLRVVTDSGETIDYDCAGEREVTAEKLLDMLDAVTHPQDGVYCHAATTLPFANVCNSLYAEVPVADFDPAIVYHTEGFNPGEYIDGLFEQMKACYDQNKSPYELGYSWAVPDTEYELKDPETYRRMLLEKYA